MIEYLWNAVDLIKEQAAYEENHIRFRSNCFYNGNRTSGSSFCGTIGWQSCERGIFTEPAGYSKKVRR